MVRGSVHMGGPIVLAWPIFQPRIARIFTNRKRLRWGFFLSVLFVFIGAIRGSRSSGQDERNRRRSTTNEVAARVSFTVETTVLLSFALPRGDCSGVSIEAPGGASSSFEPFSSHEGRFCERRECHAVRDIFLVKCIANLRIFP